MSRILHLAIGPVQGFIGSARRTRDFWAGSFLLSLLAGVAMRAVEAGGGTILFPRVEEDRLYLALEPNRQGDGPIVGSLPNRFKAEVPEGFDPEIAADAVRKRWRKIADTVRSEILSHVPGGINAEIWERQIGTFDADGRVVDDTPGFFEIAWAMGSEPGNRSDGSWLEARKNWRSHAYKTERGDHCVLMSEFQELSGFTRVPDRARQDEFWEKVREAVGRYTEKRHETYDTLELRPSERLCAIALVKRLFPLLKEPALVKALGFIPRAEEGESIRFWPSLAAIAALPWMKAAAEARPAACQAFASDLRGAERDPVLTIAERMSRIAWLVQLRRDPVLRNFAELDGKLFFDFALEAEAASARAEHERARALRLPPEIMERIERRAEHQAELTPQLLAALHKLRKELGSRFAEPSPFLTLLRMDGDEIGKLLGRKEPEKVSRALEDFTGKVKSIVQEDNGVLIYAGGDDVLAFLPLPTALQTTLKLRRAYTRSWQDGADCSATISAGLVFAHFGVPFTTIVEESRRLLEDVAKDGNGRDSIAVSVMKPSGKAVEWCTVFDQLAAPSGAGERFEDLIRLFGREGERFTTFAYNMRERYETFFKEQGGALVRPLFMAEWLKGRDAARLDLAVEQGKIEALLGVCRTCRRLPGEVPDAPAGYEEKPVTLDGALLLKFLLDNLPAAAPGRSP